MTDYLDRLSSFASRAAKGVGAHANVYANHRSFDVMAEKWTDLRDGTRQYDGLVWVKGKTQDAYVNPAVVAKKIKRELREAFG